MSKSDTITVSCGDVLNIARVGEFYTELTMILNEEKPIEVDASQLERIDISGMQVLLAFYQKAKSSGLEFSWGNPSDSFLRSAELVGLQQQLGLSE